MPTATVAAMPVGTRTSRTRTYRQVWVLWSFLPLPRKRESTTRKCCWRWRGGLASSAGQEDFFPSLYHTRSEGIDLITVPFTHNDSKLHAMFEPLPVFLPFFFFRIVPKIETSLTSALTLRVTQNKGAKWVNTTINTFLIFVAVSTRDLKIVALRLNMND